MIETLEPRAMMSAAPGVAPLTSVHRPHTTGYLFAFYGSALGGPVGVGFGNQWLRNLANDAGTATGSQVNILPEETGGPTALADLLKDLDTNHDHIISPKEIRAATVRVLGYSLGGIVATNFTRSLDAAGQRVDGYRLDAAIPVETLVTIDPVNYPITFPPLQHTDGPESNVRNFYNYYETGKSGGKSTLALYNHATGKSEGSVAYNDTTIPVLGPLHGGSLDSSALVSTQIDVGSGVFADEAVDHSTFEGSATDGVLLGKNVDHTTMPFYAYPAALRDLL